MNKLNEFFHTKDYSDKYIVNEEDEKVKYASICYIGPLFIISMLYNRKDKYMLFHINQGLNLFLIELFIFVILSLLNKIFISFTGNTPIYISIINFISYLYIVIMMLLGIINTMNLKTIELPLVGKYRFIK